MEYSENKSRACEMAGPSDEIIEILCDPCRNDGKNLPVEGYCVECEEYLCKGCFEVHCRPSVTRHHVLQEKGSMPKKRASKPETCQIHAGQPIDLYCEDHEEVCCKTCRSSSHKRCENVKPIQDILSSTDVEKEYGEMQGKMKELVSDIDKTQDLVQTNLKAIAINHDNARREMDTLRQAIKEHIDRIENDLDKELKTIRNEDEAKITSFKNACDAMHFDIKTVDTFIKGKLPGNKKYDLFVAMKKAKSKIKSNHADLEKITAENKVRRYTFIPENETKNLQTRPNSFGKFSIADQKLKSAEFLANLDAKSDKDKHSCFITGVSVIAEDLLSIVDNENKNVKLINSKINKITAEISLSSAPWDITTLSEDKIAVTLPEESKIQLFSFSTPTGDAITPEKAITVGGKCHGIDFIRHEGKLIVSFCNPGKVEILDLNGVTDQKIEANLNSPIYVSLIPNTSIACVADAIFNNKMSEYGHLKFFDLKELEKQPFTTERYKSRYSFYPFGLATDTSGYTYMCDSQNSRLYVFSPLRGNQTQGINESFEVLKDYAQMSSGINPRSITYCNKSFKLFVGLIGDKIKVYNVA